MRQSNAILRSFYAFWIEQGAGPLVNPVPQERAQGRRPHAHHNPLLSFRMEGRLRAIPDELWNELFAVMSRHRDRAILAADISTGVRAGELLGVRGTDLDWGTS